MTTQDWTNVPVGHSPPFCVGTFRSHREHGEHRIACGTLVARPPPMWPTEDHLVPPQGRHEVGMTAKNAALLLVIGTVAVACGDNDVAPSTDGTSEASASAGTGSGIGGASSSAGANS